MKLKNLKISTSLILGFGAMCLMIALIGLVALLKVAAVDDAFRTVTHQRIPRVAALNEVKVKVYLIGMSLRNLIVLDDAKDRKVQVETVLATRQAIGEVLDRLRAEIDTEKGKALLARVDEGRGRYVKGQNRIIEMVSAGQVDAAKPYLMGTVRPMQVDYFEALDALIDFQSQLLQASQVHAQQAMDAIRLTVWVVGLLALTVALGIAAWIIRSITGPLQEAVQVSRAVASGDLTLRLGDAATNETGQLMGALKQMLGVGFRAIMFPVAAGRCLRRELF